MTSEQRPARQHDLERRTFQFACDVVRVCTALETEGTVPKRIVWQLLDSGTSVGANYTESQAASSRRDLLMKQKIVLREAREARFWLQLISHVFPPNVAPLRPLLQESNELVAIFTASVKRLAMTIKQQKMQRHLARWRSQSAIRSFDFRAPHPLER